MIRAALTTLAVLAAAPCLAQPVEVPSGQQVEYVEVIRDARGPRGTPNGHSAPPNGHYDARGARTPNGHSPSNGYPPEGRGPYPPLNNGEAPPRFLTPADVPNGHGAPPNGHYDARGPRAPPPNGFRGV